MARTSGTLPSGGMAAIRRVFRRNKIMSVLLVSFLVAMLYGSVLISQADESLKNKLVFLTQEYLSIRGEQSVLSTFLTSISTLSIYLVSGFLLGFFAFGQPCCIFIILFRGFGLGLSMGQIYLDYQAQGVVDCLVLIVPAAVLFTLILTAALKDSIQLSNLFLAVLFPRFGNLAAQESLLKVYTIRYLVYFLLTFLIAALESGMNFLFSGIIPL